MFITLTLGANTMKQIFYENPKNHKKTLKISQEYIYFYIKSKYFYVMYYWPLERCKLLNDIKHKNRQTFPETTPYIDEQLSTKHLLLLNIFLCLKIFLWDKIDFLHERTFLIIFISPFVLSCLSILYHLSDSLSLSFFFSLSLSLSLSLSFSHLLFFLFFVAVVV